MCVWLIYLSAQTWDTMASCTKAEYKSSDRPAKCDYQEAECVYDGGPRVPCEVRRKGSTTWRAMNKRPSLKIKGMKGLDGEDYVFADDWVSKKVTLNNGVKRFSADAEVRAYDMFRDLGVKSSLAKLCTVKLHRGATLIGDHEDYTMIETISDKAFMKKHFGDDWVLWEVEKGFTECKRDNGVFDDECETDGSDMQGLSLTQTDREEMIRYFVGEQLTSHTDSACLGVATGNNYYVAKWVPDGTSYARHTFIPSGVDRTFGCWLQYATHFPMCKPMQQCFEDEECHSEYQKIYDNATDTLYNPMWPCVSMAHKAAAGFVGVLSALAPFV